MNVEIFTSEAVLIQIAGLAVSVLEYLEYSAQFSAKYLLNPQDKRFRNSQSVPIVSAADGI